jgi:putative aldouronate transport system permease protein
MRMTHAKPLMKNQVGPVANAVLNVLFILILAAVLVPFALLLTISFTDNDALMRDGYRFIPSVWSTKAYTFLFSETRMVLDAYKVTLIVTGLGTVGHVLLCALFAYPLTRRSLPFRGAITFFLFFTMLFSGGMVASYIINTQLLGFKNRYYALILPYLMSPWHVFIIRTYFETSIPASLEESARVDGAGSLVVFIRIILPLAKPVLATIALFSALTYWNDWFQSLLYITKESLYSLQFVMLKTMRRIDVIKQLAQMGAVSGDILSKLRDLPSESVQFAMVVVGIGPIILAYPFFQRYFIKGITIGAVKG